MKEKKLFVKMFIVFASFFVLFILSNSQVFAASKTFTFNDGNKVTFDDFPSELNKSDFYIFEDNYNYYIVNYDGSSIILALNSDNNVYSFWKDGTKGEKDGVYPLFLTCFYSKSRKKYTSVSEGTYTSGGPDIVKSYTSAPIYNYDNISETVFHPAKETILVPISKSMDFLAVTKEILGILPIILVVLIGLLALMKAIRVILQMLRKA